MCTSVLCSPAAPIAKSVLDDPGAQNSRGPTTHWGKVSMGSRGTDSPWKPHFSLEPELTLSKERRQGHGKKLNNPRTLLYFFLFVLLPCICQLLMLKMMTKKEKARQGVLSVLPDFLANQDLSESVVLEMR